MRAPGRTHKPAGRAGTGRRTLWIASAATAGMLILAAGAGAQNGFDDAGGTHEPAIDALAGEGILEDTECGERRICPDEPLLRWVMGVWLIRAADESPSTASARFTDLDPAVWWTPYVERLAELEITQGCSTSPARYCPDQPVTRGQMATFLARTFDLEDRPPAGFTDTHGNRHAEAINALAAARITTGCGENRYCPDQPITRGQMATFLARALNLTARPETPVAVNPLAFTAITAGDSYSCGIRINGSVTCWGYNRKGQTDAPYRQLTAITTGYSHTCGIRTNNTITCWGDNVYGQTVAPNGQFTAITAGSWHTCGIRTDNTVTCWGNNGVGQTDAPNGQFTAITTGDIHSCGIRTDNSLTCWGNNEAGETDAPNETFTAITAGSFFSCGIRTDNTVTCWGDNRYGQTDAPTGQFTAIINGNTHSCGIRTNGAVSCWGNVKINTA